MRSDGTLTDSAPQSFGKVWDHNIVRLGSTPTPWDHSFEREFDDADGSFPALVKWLQTLRSAIIPSSGDLSKRLSPLDLPAARQAQCAECSASLILRSPSYRHRVNRAIEGFGLTATDAVAGANVHRKQRTLADGMATGGKFAILLSGSEEFIFGDGFLHNVNVGHITPFNMRCLIPITPEIAIFYSRPWKSLSLPKAFVINLRKDEVMFVNWIIQIYSKNFLFFREIYPIIKSEFERGEHLEIEYHQHPWLDALSDSMAFYSS
ncbi:hypothetical protein [Reyranella sp.]|uniref:hypothetical protein n=1 Tax=Reyranella sp. TaxID=1929291 RepID=UPI0037830B31